MTTFKSVLLNFMEMLMYRSLVTVAHSRGESALSLRLAKIAPDHENQYTSFVIPKENKYLTQKVQNQHAFQMNLLLKTIAKFRDEFGQGRDIKLADIGDSAGTHTLYLKSIVSQPEKIAVKSVNLDPVAVEKIKSRGLDAVLCRAENLQSDHGFSADIFFAFEVLEHLLDPIRFMREIAVRTGCRYFAITVPLVHRSRLGLQYIKYKSSKPAVAENTHIFELSPEDWRLLFEFSGWKVVFEDRYYQYPLYHPLSLTRPLWRRLDVDGFYGVLLERDLTRSNQYQSW